MKKTLLNDGWAFFKGVDSPAKAAGAVCERVNLPHTWNNLDGQDGGGDYLRCACLYVRKIAVQKAADRVYYLEFKGVNSIAEAYVNGSKVARHEGGFGTFRVNVTEALADGENEIAVVADNSPNDYVYPQSADFTFFGGIYRDVYLIEAGESRFDLDYFGGSGVAIVSVPQGDGSANVDVRAFVSSPADGQNVHITSKRYAKRAEKNIKVKVYSNQKKVALFVNGKKLAESEGRRVFEFDVPLRLVGATRVEAVAGDCRDSAEFVRVLKPCKNYSLPPESTEVVNWFEKDGVRYEFEYPEGRFSVKDKIGDIIATEEGEALIMRLAEKAVEEMKARGRELPFKLSKGLLRLVSGMTVESIAAKAGGVPAEYLYNVNKELNKIVKK